MRTKSLGFLIILSLFLTLFVPSTGCASQNSSGDEEKIELVWWHWGQPEEVFGGLEKTIEAAFPQIDLVIRGIKATEYNTVLTTALQGGRGPDLFTSRINPMPAQFAQAGFVEPLTTLVPILRYYDPYALEAVSFKGQPYAVPSTCVLTAIFYNKQIFEEYALTAPRTWAELLEICEVLKGHGVTPFSMYSADWAIAANFYPTIAATTLPESWRRRLLDNEASLTDPEFVKTLQLGLALKPYFIEGWEALTYDDAVSLFATGQAAMIFDGCYIIPFYRKLNPELEFDVFLFPPVEEGTESRIHWHLDGGFTFNAGLSGKKREAAILVLNFVASSAAGEIITRDAGLPTWAPGLTGMLADPVLQKLMAWMNERAVKAEVLRGGPLDWTSPSISSLLGKYGQQLLLGMITPEEAAQRIQRELSRQE